MVTYIFARVKVLDWHDGDTFHPYIDLAPGLVLGGLDWNGRQTLSCRIAGMNAPELSTDAGKAALTYAEQLCPPGSIVTVGALGWDKYGGRFDGVLTLPNGADFATEMIAAKHAEVMR
jgi:endonuclease YncB( thermonuclease family)